MDSQQQFIQKSLADMLDVTVDSTIDILKNVSNKHIPAPVRVMLLERLANSWSGSPVPLNVPKSLRDLCKYADNNAMFMINCGVLTSFLLSVKNGISYGNNNN